MLLLDVIKATTLTARSWNYRFVVTPSPLLGLHSFVMYHITSCWFLHLSVRKVKWALQPWEQNLMAYKNWNNVYKLTKHSDAQSRWISQNGTCDSAGICWMLESNTTGTRWADIPLQAMGDRDISAFLRWLESPWGGHPFMLRSIYHLFIMHFAYRSTFQTTVMVLPRSKNLEWYC